MGRLRASVALGVVVATLVPLGACRGNYPGPDAQSTTSDTSDNALDTSDPAQRALWELGGGGDPANSPIDEFWSHEIGGAESGYTAPDAVITYRPGEVPRTACGARLPAGDWVGNAYYCDVDRTIAYDVDFVSGLIQRNGEHAGLAVLAHEWGHHVQNMQGSGLYTIQRELEADCLAAYYLGQVELLGGPDTLDSTMLTFYRLGDTEYSEVSWFGAGEHGSPNQRFAAAAMGFFAVDAGNPYCHGFGAWEPGARVKLGPWSFLEVPGHQGEMTPSRIYNVPAATLPAFTLERVQLDWEPGAPDAAASAWLATQKVAASLGPFAQDGGYALVHLEHEDADGQTVPEMVGVFGVEEDPGHVLVVRATYSGQLTARAGDEAFMVPAGLVSMIGTRFCPPGEQAEDPGAAGYNYVCDPDL